MAPRTTPKVTKRDPKRVKMAILGPKMVPEMVKMMVKIWGVCIVAHGKGLAFGTCGWAKGPGPGAQ